jgi:hypothetical protein
VVESGSDVGASHDDGVSDAAPSSDVSVDGTSDVAGGADSGDDATDDASEADAQAPAPGYLVVLQRLPYTEHFGVDERDALLDVLREATEALADLAVPLRVFYS